MMHVKQITDLVDRGDSDEAHDALDQLLALGPQNTAALKLRAQLFAFEGNFGEEAKVWERVGTVDREDPDAVDFFLRRQREDKEHFYFTDDLPGGGRSFAAYGRLGPYPPRMIKLSALGLVGCLAFLSSTRLALDYPLFAEPTTMLSIFVVCVILPWVAIVVEACRCLRSVRVTKDTVAAHTLMRHVSLTWKEIERVYLARAIRAGEGRLTLVFVPKDKTTAALEIDMTPGVTAIRTPSYLVREITKVCAEPQRIKRPDIGLETRRVARF